MSKHTVQAFFPAITDLLATTRNGGVLLPFFFPNDIADQCPQVVIDISTGHAIFLRQPFLLLMAVIGAGVGLRGMRSLPKYWSVAFGAYSMMNISAIFLHCLFPFDDGDTYPIRYPFTWTIDTYTTGVSSLGLLIASFDAYGNLKYASVLFWISHGVGVLCILWFYLHRPNPRIADSLPLELWYLMPSVFAGLAVNRIVFVDFFLNPMSFRWMTSHKLMICGFLCAGLLGIGLDQFWCRVFGTMLADLLTSTTLVFGGCNLFFLGLYQWVQRNDAKSHIH